jgi:HEAT repeat protein
MLHDDASVRLVRHAFETTRNVEARSQLAVALGLFGRAEDAVTLADRMAKGGSTAVLWNLVEALRLAGRTQAVDRLLSIAEDPDTDAAPDAVRALAAILAPNDGGKPDRVKSFDHIHAEEYLLAYVIDP